VLLALLHGRGKSGCHNTPVVQDGDDEIQIFMPGSSGTAAKTELTPLAAAVTDDQNIEKEDNGGVAESTLEQIDPFQVNEECGAPDGTEILAGSSSDKFVADSTLLPESDLTLLPDCSLLPDANASCFTGTGDLMSDFSTMEFHDATEGMLGKFIFFYLQY
jgi:hypothetical protein